MIIAEPSNHAVYRDDSCRCQNAGWPPTAAEHLTYAHCFTDNVARAGSYARKLVTAISGGVFDLFDAVLERHSLDEFGQLV